MAEVHHIHHETGDHWDSSIAVLLVVLIAIIALGAVAFFAYNGRFNQGTVTPDNTVNIEGQIDVPDVGTPATPAQ